MSLSSIAILFLLLRLVGIPALKIEVLTILYHHTARTKNMFVKDLLAKTNLIT